MFVITNVQPEPLYFDDIQLTQGEQRSVETLSEEMLAAQTAGKIAVEESI